MLAAPRRLTSTSGISCDASSLAEYTEAPASLTTTLSIAISGAPACAAIFASSLMRSAANLSVSRLAVPLPIAIRLTPCLAHSLPSVCSEPSQSLRGSCGNTVAVSTSLPVASTTATFTPVRMPGSRPITTRGPAGAASSRSRRLSAKTLIAIFSASSRRRLKRSRSVDNESFTRHVQATHLRIRSSAARLAWLQPRCSAILPSAIDGLPASGSTGSTSLASSISNVRPRNTASARCDGTRPIGSS